MSKPVVYGDAIDVDPPDELSNEGVSDWKNSLVGQFIGPAPNFIALKKIVESLWGKSALAKVSIVGPNLYVFSFANVAAKDWVLDNGPWHIQHKPLILRKLEPNLKRLDFDLSRMLIWIQLYNVPLELFSRKGLNYISSALGLPLYMDIVTAVRERLELANVCIEVEARVKIPRIIPVIMRDKSVVVVKVKIPWMPSCCSHCTLFGHSDSTCLEVKGEPVRHVAGSGKGPEWRVKSALVASSSAANVVTEVAMADSAIKAAFDPVVEPVLAAEAIGGCEFPGDVSDELAMMDATCISPGLQDYTVGGFEVACNVEEQDNLVQTGKVAPQVDEFPPLQSHSLKKSKQRGGVGKPATLVGSKNKFEILNEITNEVVVVPRKPRVAYLGVANLWQELRTKKIDKINSKGSETSSSLGGALLCNDSSFLECQGV
ncbi:hypothetical protein V6N13_052638 [Hibiscus sabdariffa]